MSSFEVARGDVVFEAQTGKARLGIEELRREFQQTTGAMSTEALRAAAAQEKLDRAIAKHGPQSLAAKQATLAYRREMSDLGSQSARTSAELRSTERTIGGLTRGALAGSGAMRGFGRSLAFASATFLGGAGILSVIRQTVSAQSQVQEETEKTGVVFGRNAADVQRWAGTLSASFGVSEAAALKAAGTFGNMLIPLHFGEGRAAAMSKRLVELAADMASFNNASPETVLQAIASGLAGQVRPLRQYGVFLSQARIQEEALADGIAKRGEKLTTQQKVQAAYNIILKDTKNAQGDVARNTESLSVAWSKLTAAVSDTESGDNKLLKSTTDLVNRGAAWLGQSKNQERIQRDVNEAVAAGVKVVHGLADAERLVAPPIRAIIGALGGLEHAVEIALIVGLVAKAKRAGISMGLITEASVAARTQIVADSAIEADAIATVGAAAATTAGELAALGAGAAGAVAAAGASTAATATEAGVLGGLLARAKAAGLGSRAAALAGKGLTIGAYIEALNILLAQHTTQPSGPGRYSGKAGWGNLLGDLVHPERLVGNILNNPGGLGKPGPPGPGQPAVLTWTDVFKAIQVGALTVQGVKNLKDRFATEADYNGALAYAEQVAREKAPRANIPTTVGGTAVQPGYLSPAQKRAQALAINPEDMTALRAQRDYDDRAIAFLKKRHAAGKIGGTEYIKQLQALEADRHDQQSTIDSINEAAAAKRKQIADAANAKERAHDQAYRKSLDTRAMQLRNDVLREQQAQQKLVKVTKTPAGKFVLTGPAVSAPDAARPPMTTLPGPNPGLVEQGNIDINNRPVAHNADGSISTVRTISISVDGREVLIPTVVNGKVVTPKEAVAHYRRTHEQLGVFSSAAYADAYAERLHREQAKLYGSTGRARLAPLTARATIETPGERDLIGFYKKESHDARLTENERQRYAHLALTEQERVVNAIKAEHKRREKLLADAVKEAKRHKAAEDKATAERLSVERSNQEQRLQNALALAQLHETEAGTNTAALAKARKEELAADLALEKFYIAQERNPKLTTAEHLGARAAEIAVREAIAQLKQQGATDTAARGQNEAQFLSSFQQIIGAYAPNAFPHGDLVGAVNKGNTHAYEQVNELRQIKVHLSTIATKNRTPQSRYASESALAAFG